MPLERLDDEKQAYRGITYKITVYYDPTDAYSGDERLIVVEPVSYKPKIETVRDGTPLNPSSILPWRDRDPLPKDEHVNRAVRRFESRIDSYKEKMEKARQ